MSEGGDDPRDIVVVVGGRRTPSGKHDVTIVRSEILWTLVVPWCRASPSSPLSRYRSPPPSTSSDTSSIKVEASEEPTATAPTPPTTKATKATTRTKKREEFDMELLRSGGGGDSVIVVVNNNNSRRGAGAGAGAGAGVGGGGVGGGGGVVMPAIGVGETGRRMTSSDEMTAFIVSVGESFWPLSSLVASLLVPPSSVCAAQRQGSGAGRGGSGRGGGVAVTRPTLSQGLVKMCATAGAVRVISALMRRIMVLESKRAVAPATSASYSTTTSGGKGGRGGCSTGNGVGRGRGAKVLIPSVTRDKEEQSDTSQDVKESRIHIATAKPPHQVWVCERGETHKEKRKTANVVLWDPLSACYVTDSHLESMNSPPLTSNNTQEASGGKTIEPHGEKISCPSTVPLNGTCIPHSTWLVALNEACANGHLRFAQWVTMMDPTLSRKDAQAKSNSLFRTTCQAGHLAVAKWLVDKFSLTKNDAADMCNAAFRLACASGRLEMAQWLAGRFSLKRSDISAVDNYALNHACENGHQAVVEWLCNKYTITSSDISGNSLYGLVRRSTENGHTALAQWLVCQLSLQQHTMSSPPPLCHTNNT